MKIQALREAMRDRVAGITDEYENRIADLRIELTEAHNQLAEAMNQLQILQEQNVQEEAGTSPAEDSVPAN